MDGIIGGPCPKCGQQGFFNCCEEEIRGVLSAKNGGIACELEAIGQMRPIETAPKDGTYILLFGPSGYITTPLRCEVCRYDDEYRPLQPWVNHADNSFLDGGGAPTHWMPFPDYPAPKTLSKHR